MINNNPKANKTNTKPTAIMPLSTLLATCKLKNINPAPTKTKIIPITNSITAPILEGLEYCELVSWFMLFLSCKIIVTPPEY